MSMKMTFKKSQTRKINWKFGVILFTEKNQLNDQFDALNWSLGVTINTRFSNSESMKRDTSLQNSNLCTLQCFMSWTVACALLTVMVYPEELGIHIWVLSIATFSLLS